MQHERNDVELQRAVIDELDWEPSVNAAGIGVTVQEGIVTLNGHVPTYAEKRAAEQAALRVSGVKAVAEELEVQLAKSAQRNDADIAKAVVDAIHWHVYLPDNQIKVKVEDGVVTLDGEVAWQYQRRHALDAVRPLVGVRRIVDLIQVKPSVTPAGVKEKIRAALERTAAADAAHITVDVLGGDVTLSGTVRTWLEREDAVRAAWAAPGVRKVTDRIKIKAPLFA